MSAIRWKNPDSGSWTDPNVRSTGAGVARGYTVSVTASITVDPITISNNGTTLAIIDPGGTVETDGLASSNAALVDNGGTDSATLTIGGTADQQRFPADRQQRRRSAPPGRIDIDGGSSALAGRQQLQALGRALARRAVRAWQHRHAAFLASALEHDLGDILVFSMSGLAFSLYAIERFPSVIAAIAACA